MHLTGVTRRVSSQRLKFVSNAATELREKAGGISATWDLEFIAVAHPPPHHHQRWLEAAKCTVNEPGIQVVPRPVSLWKYCAPVMRLTVLTTSNHLPSRSLRVGIVTLSAQWRCRWRLRTGWNRRCRWHRMSQTLTLLTLQPLQVSAGRGNVTVAHTPAWFRLSAAHHQRQLDLFYSSECLEMASSVLPPRCSNAA